MRIVCFASAILIALGCPAQASLNWQDDVVHHAATNQRTVRPLEGIICKSAKDVRNFLIFFRIAGRISGTPSKEQVIRTTNLAAHDPQACANTAIEFVGDLERVGQVSMPRINVICVTYRVQLVNEPNDAHKPIFFRDPYPRYRYTFEVEEMK